MVFDKNFWFLSCLVAINGIIAFFPLSLASIINISAACYIIYLEVNRQKRLRRYRDYAMRAREVNYATRARLFNDYLRAIGYVDSTVEYESVNWKRDGF